MKCGSQPVVEERKFRRGSLESGCKSVVSRSTVRLENGKSGLCQLLSVHSNHVNH